MPEGSGRPRALARRREPDPYEVLQISPHASQEVIHAAYRVLARRAHPDVNNGQDSTSQMRAINAAYRMLSDPHARAEYDARTLPLRIQRARRAHVEERLASPWPRSDVVQHDERVFSASVGRQSGLSRARGRVLAVLGVLGSILLLLLIAAWAINDLADERPDGGVFVGGRLADHRLTVQVFATNDAPVGQP